VRPLALFVLASNIGEIPGPRVEVVMKGTVFACGMTSLTDEKGRLDIRDTKCSNTYYCDGGDDLVCLAVFPASVFQASPC
jgi:hypothetical protein